VRFGALLAEVPPQGGEPAHRRQSGLAVADDRPAGEALDDIAGIKHLGADVFDVLLLTGAEHVVELLHDEAVNLGEVVAQGEVLADVALVVHQEDGVGHLVQGLETGSGVVNGALLGLLFVGEGHDGDAVDGLVAVAVANHLGDDRDGAGASAAGDTGSDEEGVRLVEVLGGADSIDDFVRVFFGHLGAELIDLAHAVPAGAASADEDAVLVVRGDVLQAAQVGGVSVHGEGAGDNLDVALAARPAVQMRELISNPATALTQTDDN